MSRKRSHPVKENKWQSTANFFHLQFTKHSVALGICTNSDDGGIICNVEKGLGAKVVKGLCEALYHTNRHVYFDNFFSSVNLSLDLLRKGLYSCGTLRSNRKGFPVVLKEF